MRIMGRRPKKNRTPESRQLGRQEETASRLIGPRQAQAGAPQREDGAPGQRHSRSLYTGLAVCGFLLLAVMLVFGQTLHYDFVNYDDDKYVYENARVTDGLTGPGIAWAFTNGDVQLWIPATWLSLMLDAQLHGRIAGGYHLTNVLLHAAASIGLFLVLRGMTRRLWPSALAAALFAVHPLRVESVAWVTERKDVLSGLFLVLTLGAYLGYVRRPSSLARYSAVAVLFAVGLMAKPMLVTLPFVLLLLDYWPLGRMTSSPSCSCKHAVARVAIEKIPLFILVAVCCAITCMVQGRALAHDATFPLSWRFDNAILSYITYLRFFFWPEGLAVSYPRLPLDLSQWRVWTSLLILLGVTAVAIACRWRRPYLLVGWFWYLGMLVPVIGLLQVGTVSVADRFTYLPQIGLGVALAWGVADMVACWPSYRGGCAAAAMLTVVCLIGCAWKQTSYWHDSETLWTHTLACTSQNNVAHSNLGVELARQGRFNDAIAQYQAALKIMPDDAESHSNLGNALAARERLDEAIEQYEEAVRIKPGYAAAHSNLGVALAKRGMLDQAVTHYEKALKIQPDYIEAHCNLGNALARLGRLDDAIAQYRKALELRPDHTEIRRNLGIVLSKREKTRQ
jgi:protein O-mannosyl-transferase